MAEKGQPLPKFGEWDVHEPTSAEGFTYIFNKARNEKKTGGHETPAKNAAKFKKGGGTATLGKPQFIKNGFAAYELLESINAVSSYFRKSISDLAPSHNPGDLSYSEAMMGPAGICLLWFKAVVMLEAR